jgi:hypothetical protein
MATGKTTKAASLPFRAAAHSKSQDEIAEYLEAMLAICYRNHQGSRFAGGHPGVADFVSRTVC